MMIFFKVINFILKFNVDKSTTNFTTYIYIIIYKIIFKLYNLFFKYNKN